MSVPNQNIVLIERKTDIAARDFFKIGNVPLRKAARDLDGKAFKLYIYLADNSNGYKLEMYPVDFCKWANLSDSSYRRAFKDLIDKGYLIKSNKVDNLYLFKEESDMFEKEEPTTVDIIRTVDKEELQEIIKEQFSQNTLSN